MRRQVVQSELQAHMLKAVGEALEAVGTSPSEAQTLIREVRKGRRDVYASVTVRNEAAVEVLEAAVAALSPTVGDTARGPLKASRWI